MSFAVDAIVFGVLVAAMTLVALVHLRRQGFQGAGPGLAALVFLLVYLPGLLLVRSAEREERERLRSTVEGFAPVYAHELENLGHERIRRDTPADDPLYQALIESQKRWIAANPRVADIYTFHRNEDGSTVLWVDAETDYDRNGEYEGERETRTAIGEPYDEADVTQSLRDAFAGLPSFESDLVEDRWGTWVSAFHPMYDAEGRVDAVLGVDYPAAEWVERTTAARRVRIAQILGVLGFLLGVSVVVARQYARLLDSRRQEQELLAGKAEAELESRSKSEFLANMSHEMRTPLNGILGMTDLLGETKLEARQREYVDTARASAEHLLNVITDVLDFSKIEAGKIVLERIAYSPRAVAADVRSIVLHAAMAKQIGLTVVVDPEVPQAVLGDPTRVRQVVLNLVGNAVKFTERGGVTVRVSVTNGIGDARRLTYEVRDTGIGIPADKVARVFDKFTQADSSTTRRFGGSGLGLTITRELVTLMGGTVEVESTFGAGSTFRVLVPFEPTAQPVVASADAAAVKSSAVAGLRLLVAEDNDVNRRVLQAMLDRLGCVAEFVPDGEKAVAAVREREFDAVLMDCQMPVLDGYGATREIRALPAPRGKIRIVALTANALAGDREACFAAGMDDFVTKPVKRERLLEALAAVRRTTEPAAPLSASEPVAAARAATSGESATEAGLRAHEASADGTTPIGMTPLGSTPLSSTASDANSSDAAARDERSAAPRA